MNNHDLSVTARAALPGGVSHELRYRAPHPIYIDKALGSEKWDIEGRRYIDFKMGSASQMLGHGHPAVVEALQKQAQVSTNKTVETNFSQASKLLDLGVDSEQLAHGFGLSEAEANLISLIHEKQEALHQQLYQQHRAIDRRRDCQ